MSDCVFDLVSDFQEHHCGGWNSINVDGVTQSDAFTKFYHDMGEPSEQRVWYQNESYPCAACCN